MDMMLTTRFANAGAVLTLGLGLVGLFAPGVLARQLSLTPVGRLGVSEIRATFGGLLAGLATTVLIAQDRSLFALVGAGWVGAAVGRMLSYVRDGSHEAKNVAAIGMELLLGYLLLAPVVAIWWRELFA
ncbi:MAG TPA: DUF4345 family protein [Pseudomonadales bacterium]|nr:DUF4345 family protein [Pseudomonadales bacterium]